MKIFVVLSLLVLPVSNQRNTTMQIGNHPVQISDYKLMGFYTGSLPGISHLLGVGRGNLINRFFFYQKTEGGVTGKGLNKKILIACQRNSLLIFSSHTLVFFMDSSKQFRFDLIHRYLNYCSHLFKQKRA